MAKRTNPRADPAGNGAAELGLLREMVGFNLRRAYNRAAQLFTKAFEDLDLAPIQFAALEFISKNPGTCQKDIALHIGTTPPALVGPLERLERRGWIVRSKGTTDRRRARVHLAPSGERRMHEVEERIHAVDHALVAQLSKRERERLLQLLQKLAETS